MKNTFDRMPQPGRVPHAWFRLAWGLACALWGVTFLGVVVYQRYYTPLRYSLTANYPQERWLKLLEQKSGASPLWKEGQSLIGAYPYQSTGTLVAAFAYPFDIGAVVLEDLHSQWGPGDLVKMWTSPDGETWTPQYADYTRETLVSYKQAFELALAETRQFYVKYELFAGDANRPADDHRGATLREFHLHVTPQNPWILRCWQWWRLGLLPLSVLLTLLAGIAALNVKRLERLGIAAIFGAALALRLAFVFLVPQAPLYGDPIDYNQKALTWISVLTHNFAAAAGPALSGVEGPESFYATALRNIGERSPFFSFFLAAVYLIYGEENYLAVRMIQAMLDSLTCLSLYFLGKAMFSRFAGGCAGIAAACYLPFCVAVGTVMSETFSMLLLCVTVLLFVTGLERRAAGHYVLAGGLLGLAILARYALNFLMIPFLLFLLFVFWQKKLPRPEVFIRLGAVCAGLSMTLGLWLALVWGATGRAELSGQMRHYRGIYKGLYYQGQQVDLIHIPQDSPLEAILQKQQAMYPAFADLRAAYAQMVFSQPGKVLNEMLNNLYFYWKYPYNDFQQSLGGTLAHQARYHQLLVLLGLWGIGLSLRKWQKTFFLLLPVAYLILICMMISIEIRQAVLLLPFLIVFAAYTLQVLGRQCRLCVQAAAWRTHKVFLFSLAAGMVFLGLAHTATVPILLQFAHGTITPRLAYALECLWNLLWLGMLGLLTWRLAEIPPARPEPLRNGERLIESVGRFLPIGGMLLVFGVHAANTADWREWSTRLANAKTVLQQSIVLPENLPDVTAAELKIDMQSGPGHNYDLEVRVNGQVVHRFQHALQSDAAFRQYTVSSYPRLLFFMQAQQKRLEDLRQWYTIPLEAALFQPGRPKLLDIRLRVTNPAGGLPHYVDIYGDYQDAFEPPAPLPAMGFGTTGTTPFKYMIDGDYRLRVTAEIAGTGPHWASRESQGDYRTFTRSSSAALIGRRLEGAQGSTRDLSERPGIQSGVYRIRLLLKDKNGEYLVI